MTKAMLVDRNVVIKTNYCMWIIWGTLSKTIYQCFLCSKLAYYDTTVPNMLFSARPQDKLVYIKFQFCVWCSSS